MTSEAALAVNANVTPSRDFLERQAFEAFKAFVFAFQRLVEAPNAPCAPPRDSPTKDVMTADEVAAFLVSRGGSTGRAKGGQTGRVIERSTA